MADPHGGSEEDLVFIFDGECDGSLIRAESFAAQNFSASSDWRGVFVGIRRVVCK